jgi:CBS domain-containing protein
MSIAQVAHMMVERDCGALPVVSDLALRRAVGIVTDRDIVTRTIAQGRDPMIATVRECMTSPVLTIREDARLSDCVDLLETSQVRRAVVVDEDDSVCGIIAQADIALHASKRATGDMVRQVSKRHTPAFVSTHH